MSELNDLLTTRELQRWRLILGEAAETTLCGLDDNARQIDHALEWLYGRDPERLQRGERSGGLGGSNLTTPEWINSIHTLFPQQVIERLESDAVLRYGIEDVVTNLDVLERMQPSESLLRAVLHTKHLMNPEVLAAARQIVRFQIVRGQVQPRFRSRDQLVDDHRGGDLTETHQHQLNQADPHARHQRGKPQADRDKVKNEP